MFQNIRPAFPFSLVSCFFLFFSMIISLTTLAKKIGDKTPVFSKTIVVGDLFQQLEVWGNIEIVLTPDLSDSIVVEGSSVDINLVGIKLKKGTLSVRGKWISPTSATKLIIPAAMLNTIKVYGNALISSAGELAMPELRVYLDGEARVSIRSRGQVNVEASDGYYLTKEPSRFPASYRAKVLTRAEEYYWGGVQAGME